LIIYQFLNCVERGSSSGFDLDISDPDIARYFNINEPFASKGQSFDAMFALQNFRHNLQLLDIDKRSGEEQKRLLDDLLRIKHSVLTELRYIEQVKRNL